MTKSIKGMQALFLVALFALAVPPAQAANLFSDDFEGYTVGNNIPTGGNWAQVTFSITRNESTATPFGSVNKYAELNDASTANGLDLMSANITDTSGAVTTYSFDFFEPSAGGSDTIVIGYAMENQADLASARYRLRITAGDGTLNGVASAYSLDTAYRLHIIFNDSGSAVSYDGGTIDPGTAHIWYTPLSGGYSVFAGTATTGNTQTATYRVGFTTFNAQTQEFWVDNVSVDTGVPADLVLPEEIDMAVLYDGEEIAVGATNAITATFVNTPVSRTYVVTNLASSTGDLLLTNSPAAVVFDESGTTNYNGFTITENITGGATNIAPGGSTSFTLSFVTNTVGSYTGTVSIANNDPDEDPYTFTVTLEALAAAEPTVTTNAGVTVLSTSSATLRGELTAGILADAYIAWGSEIGSTDSTNGWQHVVAFEGTVQDVPFETTLSDLLYGIEYHYLVYAENNAGTNVTDVVSFSTPAPLGVAASGGDITVDGGVVTHTFTNLGEAAFAPLYGDLEVEYLLVGGGGGGNGLRGGGGGGGGVVTGAFTAASSAYPIVVGAGGNPGSDGVASTAFGFTAGGGGAGGVGTTAGNPGTNSSSGGGSGFDNDLAIGVGLAGGLGDSPGYDGGAAYKTGNYYGMGGGGGGAGGDGADATDAGGGNGGIGIEVWGTRYAGGGGGGTRAGSAGAGVDGGGDGGLGVNGAATQGGEDGTPNTGGGGGGSGGGGTGDALPPGSGGSGIVIVRYAAAPSVGVVSTSATNVMTTAATLQGTLSATQSVFTVTAFWGTNDYANGAAWEQAVIDMEAQSAVVGTFTNEAERALSWPVSGLDDATIYYYTFSATNALSTNWAANVRFDTQPAPNLHRLSPEHAEIDVLPGVAPTVAFDTGIFLLDANGVTLSNLTAQADVALASVVVSDGTNLVITPAADLAFNTVYAVLIAAGTVDGYVGIADTNTWAFTTMDFDSVPPSPATMTFAVPPYAIGPTAIAMTATTATDENGVEYYFAETSGNAGGTDSGWQSSTAYTNAGLLPETTYTYTVQARDASPNQNQNTVSAPLSATTDPQETDPPTPDPMSFAVAPQAVNDQVITMTASEATDALNNPVEYLFTNTVAATDSGWIFDTQWTESGLADGTEYIYQVKARDAVGNETAWSVPSSATTLSYLANYQFDDGSYASIDINTNSVASDWAAGPGIALGTSSDDGGDPLPPALATTYGNVAGTLDAILTANDYYTFTITPGEGKQITYESLAFNWFNSGGQPITAWLFTSLDGFDAGNLVTSVSLADGSPWTPATLDLSSLISNVAVAVEYRIYLDDNGAGTGTHRIRMDSFILQGTVTDAPVDNDPPEPNPMTFAQVPIATGETSITMTATPAIDDNPVQYYFAETSGNPGGNDSGWQTSTNYTNTGLLPDTTYSYTVTARDLSPAVNTNTDSAVFTATTDPDGTPPSPDPMAFAIPPASIDASTITMTAALATDTFSPPVQYYIENTTNGSVRTWSTDRAWENTGLVEGKVYGYRVKARDARGNETDWSSIATAVPRTLIAAYRFDGGSFTSVDNEIHSLASDLTNGSGVPLETDGTLGSPAAASLALTMSQVTDLLGDAITANDYYTFTITPQTRKLDLDEISFRFYKSLGQEAEISVFSSDGGFAAAGDMVGDGQLVENGVWQTFTVDLSGLPRELILPIEFRLYVTSGGTQNQLRIDTIEITGVIVPLSPSVFRFR